MFCLTDLQIVAKFKNRIYKHDGRVSMIETLKLGGERASEEVIGLDVITIFFRNEKTKKNMLLIASESKIYLKIMKSDFKDTYCLFFNSHKKKLQWKVNWKYYHCISFYITYI